MKGAGPARLGHGKKRGGGGLGPREEERREERPEMVWGFDIFLRIWNLGILGFLKQMHIQI